MLHATRESIIEHAKREYPREACGLVVNATGHERYIECKNISESQTDFIMDPADYARAEDMGQIITIVHSHPNTSAKPSQADLVACEASGIPWLILAYPGLTWNEFHPSGYRAPLIGRSFVHGVLDCYSIVRDWYCQERGVNLLDFERKEKWWEKGENLYLDNFEKAGFVRVSDGSIEIGDVILMQIQSKAVNHGAIYLGNNVILHHVMNRLSCREIYGGFWLKNTRAIVRYRGPQ